MYATYIGRCRYGVDAITVGANDGSTPPNVPDVDGG